MNKVKLIGVTCLMATLSACQSTQTKHTAVSGEGAQRVAMLEQQLKDIKSKNSRLTTDLKTANMAQSNVAGSSESVDTAVTPVNAKPGECYVRIAVPAVFESKSIQKLKTDSSQQVSVTPAKYGWAEKRVLVEEEQTRLKVVPAVYGWKTEEVMVEPEKKTFVTIPAVYDTVSEKILDKPAHTAWKVGKGEIQKIDDKTGEIMCLVEVPAVYRTVTSRVLISPERVDERVTPAVYKAVKRKVVAVAEHTEKETIPAKYKMVKVRTLITPAKTLVKDIPAEYATYSVQKKVAEGYTEWRSILCETNTTPSLISDLQLALDAKDFNPGPIDGIIGSQTISAVNEYQLKNKLPVDKHLNIKTLKHIGVL